MKKYLGSVFTNVASLIVGDPCKLLKDIRRQDKYTYYNFLNRTILEEDAIIVNTNNCDGWCNVFIDDEKMELIVDINPRAKPGE